MRWCDDLSDPMLDGRDDPNVCSYCQESGNPPAGCSFCGRCLPPGNPAYSTQNADWAKSTLDLAAAYTPGLRDDERVAALREELGWLGISLEEFRESPAYRLALESGHYAWLWDLLTPEEEEAHAFFLLDRATWPVGDPHAAPVEEFELH